MKANKVHDMSNEELVAKLEELKKELFNLRLNHATGQLNNPLALSVCKKDIARVKTVLRERAVQKGLKGTRQMERTSRKTRIGTVVSDKMDKTIVVAVVEKFKHPLYKKTVSKTKKFKAHDEQNQCGIGDTVLIAETRKLSKDKNWRLVQIVEKAK